MTHVTRAEATKPPHPSLAGAVAGTAGSENGSAAQSAPATPSDSRPGPLRPGPLRNGNPRGNPNLAPRCGAKSRTTGCPCRAPAMPNGRCRMHGGKSTGPRTAAGLAALARAHTTHGNSTAAARADRRYLRTVITHNHVLAAAMQLRPYLPAEIGTRFDHGADELAAPPYPSPPADPPTPPDTQPEVGHPAPVPPVGRSAQGSAQPRDAHGRFTARPRPMPRGTKAERAAARAERAMLAPWRAGIKRARMVRRLLALQAQNARRAQRAQHASRSLPLHALLAASLATPLAADPAATTQHAATAPAGSVAAADLHRGVPLVPAERFALAGRNAIHRETAPHPAPRGESPVKTSMQRDTVAPPAAPAGARGEAAVKTLMQRGTVAHPAEPNAATGNTPAKTFMQRGTVADLTGPAEAIGEAPGTQAMHRPPPAARPEDAPPAPASAPTRDAPVKTLLHRGTVPWSMNPLRCALLASTARTDPAALELAAQVERAGGWPVLIAIDAANQAGTDWRPAVAAAQRRLAEDIGRARTVVLYDPSLRAALRASLARRNSTPDAA